MSRRHSFGVHHYRLRGPLSPLRERLRHLVWGGGMIALGAAFLSDPQMVQRGQIPWLLVALVVAWTGVSRMVCEPGASGVVRGLTRIALAGWVYAAATHLWDWSLQDSWPIALIIIGCGALLRGLLGRSATAHEELIA